MTDAREMPEWPERIVRDGPYKVYKGHKYTVYDDGNSAETPYQTDLAEAALARLRVAVAALREVRNYDVHPSFERAIQTALSTIGEVPGA